MEWLSKNREWVFSGIGVVVFTTLAGFVWQLSENDRNASQTATTGDNSTVVQVPGSSRDINIYPNSQDNNFNKEVYPVIDLTEPINGQVQLFPTDKVQIYADTDLLKEVWFGEIWEPYEPGREYVVWGIPSQPITPRFKFDGKTRVKMRIKVSVNYSENLNKPRDIRFRSRD